MIIQSIIVLLYVINIRATDVEVRCMQRDIDSVSLAEAIVCIEKLSKSPNRERNERACQFAEKYVSETLTFENVDYCF